MKLTVQLMPEETIIRSNPVSPPLIEEAAAMVVREFLHVAGYLELPHELDEHLETLGEA